MTHGDDETMKVATIGAALVIIWAIRMAIIALK
jgi:hypothetical protein